MPGGARALESQRLVPAPRLRLAGASDFRIGPDAIARGELKPVAHFGRALKLKHENRIPLQPLARLEIVVAVAQNGVIGRANGLPWHLRADLQHFKQITWGHPMLMGRRTWESIGRPLPGRRSLVLSRDPALAPAGANVVRSLAEARELGRPLLMVIGGADVFRLALADTAVLHLTEIEATVEGDVFFPAFRREEFVEEARERHAADAENDYPFSFVRLVRRTAA